MKRSNLIKKALKSKRNTVFTTKEQVDVALTIFERLGMQPPNTTIDKLFPNSKLKANAKDLYSCWEPEDET